MRPVQRVVAVLAALSTVALAREVLHASSARLVVAPAALATQATPATNGAPAFDLELAANDLACSPSPVGFTSDDTSASAVQDVSVASIGPPAPPVAAAPAKPRVTPRAKVAVTTVRAAPTPLTARTKSLSTAALLHAVRAQHAKAAPHK